MTHKLLAAAALTLTSLLSGISPATAETRYHSVSDFVAVAERDEEGSYRYEQTLQMGSWENHSSWKVIRFSLPEEFSSRYEAVLQLNVRSTNKSQYNALYLNPEEFSEESFNGCDPHYDDRYEQHRVNWLPYSEHEKWRFIHKTFNGSKLRSGENVLLICARNEHGEMWGELDNFYLKDVVVHYRKRLPFYSPDSN